MDQNSIVQGRSGVPMPAEFGKLFQEEMQGLSFSFDRVKIPSGGGLAFEVPGDDDENPDVIKELVGVIVDHHPVNAFWMDKYSGQNNPPDCSSLDGVNGYEMDTDETKPCALCPYNEWGSGEESRGKACKNMHRVYIKRSDGFLPLLLTLPPTSLKNFSNFLAKRVLGKGRRSSEVLMRVTLKKATSSQGIVYSQAAFSVLEVLSDALSDEMRAYSELIKPLTRQIKVTQDDYNVDEEQNLEKYDSGDKPF